MSKPIFVVFGATGAQGGSVIRAILGSPQLADKFQIRGVCRDTTKPAASALREKGVEVVSANLNSADDVRKVLSDAYGVFLVTDYSGNAGDAKVEYQQGKHVADAAKEYNLEHVIFSSLFSGKKLSSGAITKAYEFDSKAGIEDYMRDLELPATFVFAGTYMSLCTPGVYLQQIPSSSPDSAAKKEFVLAFPVPVDTPFLGLIDTPTDFGKFVRAALLNRDKYLGQRLYAAEAYYSATQVADIVNRQFADLGYHVTPKALTDDEFLARPPYTGANTGDRQQQQLALFQFVRQYGYYGGASLDKNAEIVGEPLKTYPEYIKGESKFRDVK